MAERVLPYEVNCSILFTELPLLERPAAAKEAGFDAVEFWWPYATAVPSDREVDEFVRAVGDAGVRLAGLNFFAGDMGTEIDGVVEFEELATRGEHAPTALGALNLDQMQFLD